MVSPGGVGEPPPEPSSWDQLGAGRATLFSPQRKRTGPWGRAETAGPSLATGLGGFRILFDLRSRGKLAPSRPAKAWCNAAGVLWGTLPPPEREWYAPKREGGGAD